MTDTDTDTDNNRWRDAEVPWRDRPWPAATFDECDLTFDEAAVPPSELGRVAADRSDTE